MGAMNSRRTTEKRFSNILNKKFILNSMSWAWPESGLILLHTVYHFGCFKHLNQNWHFVKILETCEWFASHSWLNLLVLVLEKKARNECRLFYCPFAFYCILRVEHVRGWWWIHTLLAPCLYNRYREGAKRIEWNPTRDVSESSHVVLFFPALRLPPVRCVHSARPHFARTHNVTPCVCKILHCVYSFLYSTFCLIEQTWT